MGSFRDTSRSPKARPISPRGRGREKYNNIDEDGVLDRRTPYGFGMPRWDMRTFGKKSTYGATIKHRIRLICDYKRDMYQRYRVSGRAAETCTESLASRIPNERCGICLFSNIKSQPAKYTPSTSKATRQRILQTGTSIFISRKGETSDFTCECGYCGW